MTSKNKSFKTTDADTVDFHRTGCLLLLFDRQQTAFSYFPDGIRNAHVPQLVQIFSKLTPSFACILAVSLALFPELSAICSIAPSASSRNYTPWSSWHVPDSKMTAPFQQFFTAAFLSDESCPQGNQNILELATYRRYAWPFKYTAVDDLSDLWSVTFLVVVEAAMFI